MRATSETYLVGINLSIALLRILLAGLKLAHRDVLRLDLSAEEAQLTLELIGALQVRDEAPLESVGVRIKLQGR